MTLSRDDQQKVQAITDKLTGERHKKWLTEFADEMEMTFEGFIADLQDCIENGSAMYVGSNEMDVPAALWEHYEALYGPVPPEKKTNFWFSCSC